MNFANMMQQAQKMQKKLQTPKTFCLLPVNPKPCRDGECPVPTNRILTFINLKFQQIFLQRHPLKPINPYFLCNQLYMIAIIYLPTPYQLPTNSYHGGC